MLATIVSAGLLLQCVSGFGFVADESGIKNVEMLKRQLPPSKGHPGSLARCPFNAHHVPAAPITKKYPYNGAINGLPGKGKGGFQVPADGDHAHRFIQPNPKRDIRGPCPGLNAMANHGFLARDGITSYTELVDAQQNVYNVGYDLANVLAILGLTVTDGDIVTEKLSIGCDATPRTSFAPKLTGSEPGLAGHNKFEADTSLAHTDFFIGKGDNFNFNASLFQHMTEVTKGVYNLENLAKYRFMRYHESLSTNKHFYFGPLSLLLFGAASFLYELMPSGTRNYAPDYFTISHFFGAEKLPNGKYRFNNQERIPPNWTNRELPYNVERVGFQIFKMYSMYPVLFGGATGEGQFDVISGNGIQNGHLNATDPSVVTCTMLQLLTARVPSSLNGVITPSVRALAFVVEKLGPTFKNFGCPINVT